MSGQASASFEGKGNSPFYPSHPVPVDLFRGRQREINQLVEWGVKQTSNGKPTSFFIEGEYGIGKSSIAQYVAWVAESGYNLLTINAQLGGVRDLEEVGVRVLRAAFTPQRADKNHLRRMIEFAGDLFGQQQLFGVNINLAALKSRAPTIADSGGLRDFLFGLVEYVRRDVGDVAGVMLVLDEINGIASKPEFAHYLKGFVDSCTQQPMLPVMLVLCGTRERRAEMITNHEPVNRLFEVVEIESLDAETVRRFFTDALDSVGYQYDEAALKVMVQYSGGLPRVMHVIGDRAFRVDTDRRISAEDAFVGILEASLEIGRNYVDSQIASPSADYRRILDYLGSRGINAAVFTKKQIVEEIPGLPDSQAANFLTRMRERSLIRPTGNAKGEYEFVQRIALVYLVMRALRLNREGHPNEEQYDD